MKINIQKIAYRAIPLLTALVVLLSSVVVGNPLSANAASVGVVYTDNSLSEYSGGLLNRDRSIIKLTPNPTYAVHADGGIYSYKWETIQGPDVTSIDGFSLFLGFQDKFYKGQENLGNTLNFAIDTRISQGADGGTYERFANYVALDFYTASGYCCKTVKIHGSVDYDAWEVERYQGTYSWPDDASYFKVKVCMSFDTRSAKGKFYFFLNSVTGEGDPPTVETYNSGYYGQLYTGMKYCWNLPRNGDPYSYIYTDLRWSGGTYQLRLPSSDTKLECTNFQYGFWPDCELEIFYHSNVVFDISRSLFTGGSISYYMFRSWVVAGGGIDVESTWECPIMCINYYDETGAYICSQYVECSNCSATLSIEQRRHKFNFSFDYPLNASYVTFSSYQKCTTEDYITFHFGIDEFFFNFYRDQEAFDLYVNGLGELPEITGGNGPSISGESLSIGSLIDMNSMTALVSPIKELWNIEVLTSMLVLVVSLCLVSWVFFGKKG